MFEIAQFMFSLIFAALSCWAGYRVASRFKSPASASIWILVIIGLLLSPTIGTTSYLIYINGLNITVSRILFAFMLGLILRMAIRHRGYLKPAAPRT